MVIYEGASEALCELQAESSTGHEFTRILRNGKKLQFLAPSRERVMIQEGSRLNLRKRSLQLELDLALSSALRRI